jgi:hypothetical protein
LFRTCTFYKLLRVAAPCSPLNSRHSCAAVYETGRTGTRQLVTRLAYQVPCDFTQNCRTHERERAPRRKTGQRSSGRGEPSSVPRLAFHSNHRFTSSLSLPALHTHPPEVTRDPVITHHRIRRQSSAGHADRARELPPPPIWFGEGGTSGGIRVKQNAGRASSNPSE